MEKLKHNKIPVVASVAVRYCGLSPAVLLLPRVLEAGVTRCIKERFQNIREPDVRTSRLPELTVENESVNRIGIHTECSPLILYNTEIRENVFRVLSNILKKSLKRKGLKPQDVRLFFRKSDKLRMGHTLNCTFLLELEPQTMRSVPNRIPVLRLEYQEDSSGFEAEAEVELAKEMNNLCKISLKGAIVTYCPPFGNVYTKLFDKIDPEYSGFLPRLKFFHALKENISRLDEGFAESVFVFTDLELKNAVYNVPEMLFSSRNKIQRKLDVFPLFLVSRSCDDAEYLKNIVEHHLRAIGECKAPEHEEPVGEASICRDSAGSEETTRNEEAREEEYQQTPEATSNPSQSNPGQRNLSSEKQLSLFISNTTPRIGIQEGVPVVECAGIMIEEAKAFRRILSNLILVDAEIGKVSDYYRFVEKAYSDGFVLDGSSPDSRAGKSSEVYLFVDDFMSRYEAEPGEIGNKQLPHIPSNLLRFRKFVGILTSFEQMLENEISVNLRRKKESDAETQKSQDFRAEPGNFMS